ncbi:MAG: four helix bundle protein [Aureispira sp.]|nr:four helix bundle protein [Aureispira sp.]
MMNNSIIGQKSFEFAILVVNTYKQIVSDHKEYVLSRQFLRSGTSVGANVKEAQNAQSKADFIHKLSISLKEAGETEYWIELLYQTNYINKLVYQNIKDSVTELLKMLTAIIKTTKNNLTKK